MARVKAQRIGLFGGTFDPVHLGHLVVAEWITDSLELDTTFFIPNHVHPFLKRNDIVPGDHRFEMVRLAVADYPRFRVSDIEIRKEGVSYTIDTIHYFRDQYPGCELFYLMGADNLNEFTSWKQPHEILKLAYLVVYSRVGTEIADSLRHEHMILIDSPFIDISSTHIRHRIKSGRSFQSLVPGAVYKYIIEHKLYLDK